MAVDERQKTVDKFNALHPPTVFIISAKAGAVGLSIQTASRVVLFDLGYYPATEEIQAIVRAYRFGQERPVFVY